MPIELEELQLKLEKLETDFKNHGHFGTENKKIRYEDLEDSIVVAHGTVYRSVDLANTGGPAKITFDTELFTTVGITWDSANNRFTALKAGKYLITAIVYWGNVVGDYRYAAYIYKNGSIEGRSQIQASMAGSNDLAIPISRIVNLAVGNYVEIFAGHTQSPTSYNISGGSTYTIFSIIKV